jgi:hypothetical protein
MSYVLLLAVVLAIAVVKAHRTASSKLSGLWKAHKESSRLLTTHPDP